MKDLPIKPGQNVKIPKGAPFTTTHPQKTGVQYTKKAYRVHVRFVIRGYPAVSGYEGQDDALTWAGQGGYWCTMALKHLSGFDL
jgi:hypothetical protein